MPLRPDLYNRLLRRLGGPIGFAHEGEAFWADVQGAAFGKPRLEVHWPGEYLRVNCPFCLDRRQRLWINHMWGFRHPQTGGLNLWLATCYNETKCMAKPGKARELYHRLFNDVGTGPGDVVLPGRKVPRIVSDADLTPGKIYPLHELPHQHRAVQYVRRRGFNPSLLGSKLGIGYCFDDMPSSDHFPMVQDRLFIPVNQNGKRVGWQSRSLNDSSENWPPKYFTMPGMKKSEILYNFDHAKHQPYMVVCEGVTDVWRVGPSAVALFGQHASVHQRQLLAATCIGKRVFILLDGDAIQSAAELEQQLRALGAHAVRISLPEGKDPGMMFRDELSKLLRDAEPSALTR